VSVFDSSCFLFLRDPRGGVEDLDRMQAAGFAGVFCNIGDHAPGEWEAVIRPRALQRGMVCGPWLRTQGADGGFSTDRLSQLIRCADQWQSPLIVNAESELKGSGATYTSLIRDAIGEREAAVSVEPQPFADVHWYPLAHIPVLPQVFGLASQQQWFLDQWHAYGVECVYMTFGTYGDWTPNDYTLQAPYSLYTADDCGGDYGAWQPRSSGYQGCVDSPTPPDEGDDMQTIGDQHGVDAAVDRLIKLDPSGSKPNRNPDDLSTWGAYDKLRRTLTILVDDHDEQAGKAAT
jgi:hypothetical protein